MKTGYTDKEIEIIKSTAYDRGRIEGCLITLCVVVIFTILALI